MLLMDNKFSKMKRAADSSRKKNLLFWPMLWQHHHQGSSIKAKKKESELFNCWRILASAALLLAAVVGLVIVMPDLRRNFYKSHPRSNIRVESLMGSVTPEAMARFRARLGRLGSPHRAPVTEQEDLFISVKTSHQFHRKRLDVLVKTWFQLAREQTWFFTDREDREMSKKTGKGDSLALFEVHLMT